MRAKEIPFFRVHTAKRLPHAKHTLPGQKDFVKRKAGENRKLTIVDSIPLGTSPSVRLQDTLQPAYQTLHVHAAL